MEHLAMKNTVAAVAFAVFAASTFSFQSHAATETDACSLVTAAQVSAAVGFQVGDGKHVTPTFVKTCTWTGTAGSGVQTVTLNLQTGVFYDGARKQAAAMTAAGAAVKSAGLGDDSFYYVLGTQVDLWVKKGGNACKITIYKQIAVEQKQAIELSLAKQVVAKL
jgi:hypothetical protein